MVYKSRQRANRVVPLHPREQIKSRDNLDPLVRRGIALHQRGQLALAQMEYLRVLVEDRRHPEALHRLGVLAAQSHRPQLARSLLEQSVEIAPDNPIAQNNLGIILLQADCIHEALRRFERATKLHRDYAEAHNNRGCALQALNRHEEALGSHDRAIASQRNYPEAHNNKGNALQALHRYKDAIAAYDQALLQRFEFADAHYNRGNALRSLNRLEEALASYDRALSILPHDSQTLWNKCHTLLALGEFESGLPLFERRWQQAGALQPRAFDVPLWLGQDDIAGKRILLHAEQGLGDTIQFARYVTLVQRLGAEVILEAQPPLVPILRSLPTAPLLITRADVMPPVDFHCPLLSLPLALRTSKEGIPAFPSYLRPDPTRVCAWSARLGRKAKPRIGIVWSGSESHEDDTSRSLSLAKLLPLLHGAFEWHCLQKDVRKADREALGVARHVVVHGNAIADFSDTAALCELVDLVISVDTSVAHLAGALGRPTWILLPFSPDWRWQLNRNDCPWYPSARLFRQEAPQDWTSVLELVAQAMEHHLANSGEMTLPQFHVHQAMQP